MSIEIGQVIGQHYRVLELLGFGGMGRVYKVWDLKRSVFLVMKVLNSDLSEEKIFLRRFKREADTLAKLNHPFIVRYYGLQEEDGLDFILMDYIDGSTLRREIKETPGAFTPQRILEIMRPVCAALDFAHHSNFVHCDIKPANILEDQSGKVFLSDFGIARMMDATSSSNTLAGAGTPSYMAPEQIRGESPIPQTDIYALGVVLFELATGGERPFTGEQAAITGTTSEKVRWEHIHSAAPSPCQYNPAIPSELERIILRCLEKDAAKRFESATGMYAELEYNLKWMIANGMDLRDASPISDIIPPPEPKGPIRRTKPWMWMGGAAVVVILLTVALAFGGGGPKPTPTPIVLKTDTLVSILPTKTVAIAPALTYTPSPKPLDTPTITLSTTPQILTCSASLACTQFGQSCVSPTDGMTLMCVPAGSFIMGADESATLQSFSIPDILRSMGGFTPHPVSLDAFWIDQTEVTNGMYARFVSATHYKTSAEAYGRAYVFSYSFQNEKDYPYWKELTGASWLHPFGPSSDLQGKDNYPVVSVSWIDAYQYCQWATRQLPTEAQWEKAARGNHAWFFPWGNQFPSTSAKLANFADASLQAHFSETQTNDGFEFNAPVGSFPNGKSPYGVQDMAGNAMEWVEDAYDPNAYRGNSTNPRYPGDPSNQMTERVLRGGSWATALVRIRVSDRDNMIAVGRRDDLGFRCASSAGK
jgi:eukaryotic-like serine/threonine-protein kinase